MLRTPLNSDTRIRVVCRFRPQNQRELKEGGKIVVQVNSDSNSATIQVQKKIRNLF